MIDCLSDVKGIIPFEQIKTDYGLGQGEQLRCIQLCHWVMGGTVRLYASRRLTPFEKWYIIKGDDTILLSAMYSLLGSAHPQDKSAAQKRREEELC